MAGPVKIAILANGSQVKREVLSVNRTLGGLGKGLRGGLAVAGLTSLTAGVVGFGISAIKTEKQFSTSMRLIQASTGATAGQMKQLNDLAIRLGADTAFSANDAADAMLELSKAGLNTKTIMGGGVAGTLTLAAAGGTDLATAATIASNALNTFNLNGKDTEAVAAALAGGANASTASVESLGQALQQVGPGATNAGLSLQETVAALAAFDSAGIKGSDAGTSLKTMLTRLVPSTTKAAKAMDQLGLDFTKADGSFLSLDKIAQQLQDRLSGLTQEQRTQALATVFGSDATRAATVLMNEGAEGIRKYVKATNDQSAAQKMAKARMSGTEGALERLSGSIETAKLRLGQELAPIVTKTADGLSDKLVPAMEAGIDAVKLIGSSLQPVVPLLKTFGEVVVDIAQFVDGLPTPLKEMGIQAGVAALVMPRLAAGVTAVTATLTTNVAKLQQWRAEMSYTATRAQALSSVTSRLGGAAKTAAGIGGMLALTQATQQTDKTTSTLVGTLGGAAAGFAVGGPWGAAIGGAAGLLGGLTGALGNTEEKAREAARQIRAAAEQADRKDAYQTLIDTLDQVTGAYTGASRAAIAHSLFDPDGNLEPWVRSMTEAGISLRTITTSIMSGGSARSQINTFFEQTEEQIASNIRVMGQYREMLSGPGTREQVAFWESEIAALTEENNALAANQEQWRNRIGQQSKATKSTQELAIASGNVTKALKGIEGRGRIVTRLDMAGDWPTSERQIARLIRGLGLTPSEVKTVMEVLGVEGSVKNVQRLATAFKDQEREGRKSGEAVGTGYGQSMIEALTSAGPPAARAATTSIYGAGRAAAGPARTGGNQVGAALSFGAAAGIAANSWAVQSAAIAVINRAIAAARQAADAHSPSRKTEALGKDMADGIVVGVTARAGNVEKSLQRFIRRALRGLTNGSSGIGAALDRITDLIRKQIDLKDDKKEKQREQEILRNLRDQYDALQDNGKAQDRLNKRLEEARNKLREIKGWVNQVKQSFIDTGNITTLGIIEGGNGTEVSGGLLIDQLKDQVADAERFAALIKRLRKEGLNKTTLEQLLAAGPEAGLAAAEALDHMTEAELKQINDLTQQLAGAGQQLGESMSSSFFAGGLGGAEQTLKNLLGDQKDLEKEAERLGRRLARALRRALRGGRGEGTDVLAELLGGSVDTHASDAGRRLGRSMREGFDEGSARSAWMTEGHQPQTQEITVRVSPDEWDRARRGKDIRLDLEASDAIGVRVKAVKLVSKR